VARDKEPYILLTMYQNLYKDKYGVMPTLNKYREKWAMQDVVDSVGFDRAKEILEYYFHTNKFKHPINFFFYNFDKMDTVMKELDKDREFRHRLMQETKKMVEEE
jgi:hypothetical protein